jgi:hypothetical protein
VLARQLSDRQIVLAVQDALAEMQAK